MTARFLAAAALTAFGGAVAGAQGTNTDCNAPTPDPIVHLALPGNPFTPSVTADGCWIFVAMGGGQAGSAGGVAVVRRDAGRLTLERTVPLKQNGTGAALTNDGKMLIVAAATSVAFLDAQKLISGAGDPLLGYLDVRPGAGVIYVTTTKDDATLFVALERERAILVVDLAKVRAARGAIDSSVVLGTVPVGTSPVAVTLSNDERYLYTTSQSQAPGWNWPLECKPEAQSPAVTEPQVHSKGAIVVIDVARARTDAAGAVVAKVPVGCNPVRLVLTPDGNTAWVSTRGDHAIVAVDVRKLLTDPAHAILVKLPVGTAPVGIAIADASGHVFATNSNRFAGTTTDQQSINVVDASNGAAAAKVVGAIPAGAFPRELRITPDGKVLVVTNFASRTLQIVDLARLPAAKKDDR